MRITSIIIGIQAFFTTALLASTINAQNVSLNISHAKVVQVFTDIEKQTNVTFVYNAEAIAGLNNVSIKVDKKTLSDVLIILSQKLPLQFRQSGTVIGVDRILGTQPKEKPIQKPIEISTAAILTITGKVLNENGLPLSGASVRVKGSSLATSTDQNGAFTLANVRENGIIVISYVGYLTKEVVVSRDLTNIIVTLALASSRLDEVVIIPYGTTTERLNTGSVAKVSTKEIDEEPVSNPLAALQGRVAGLVVTQGSGLPGSSYSVQVRGQNSILSGTDPLYIVDGVPFNGTSLDEVSLGYPSKQSPFNSISPNDIESIEVLKDADATAIYGSRGANGVILITTKKGKSGKTRIDADVNSGFGKVTRTMQFMNTAQYLSMREEAFRNDNRAITPSIAYDLVSWDTTRDVNWQQMLIGGTAHQTNAQASISGGNDQTQFLVGTNYHRETTVFPGDFNEQRADVHFNINHQSVDNRFSMIVTGSYSNDVNHMIQGDLFANINLPPDAPNPYDANGNLVWQENGYYYLNPLAPLYQPYTATTDNLLGNINLSYKILPGLIAKVDAGYTYMQLDQVAITPADSQYPPFSPESYSTFGSNNVKGWIIEPQLNYTRTIGKGTLEALLGGSEQQQIINGDNIFATGYSSDALLASTSGASSVSSSSNYSEYRYQAIFGRLHYMWDNKYILNVTGRRDGSSRFGPGKQYANFGAIGAAWIFSEESLIKNKIPFLSYGKLRGSYGITGNDQIGDYRYLDTWRPTVYPYQGITGLQSFTLFNPNYAWEMNRKLEAAVDLGFLKDRILFSASYFRNRSSDQLINYTLPGQTGFSGVLENLPALVQNSGWEFTLNTVNIQSKAFRWSTSINLTTDQNKLLSFPGLSTSSYAHTYVIGQPLNIKLAYHYLGVDPATGIYQFAGTINPTDKTAIINLNPQYYGGISNSFSYKRFQLDFLFQFVKQRGANYYATFNGFGQAYPGSMFNLPVQVLDHWQHPGDMAPIGVYTSGTNATQRNAVETYYPQSDAVYTDASFVRLKNLSLTYNLPNNISNKLGVQHIAVYLRGQDLLTFTDYFGFDPENQSSALPPLKYIIAGIRFTLQ